MAEFKYEDESNENIIDLIHNQLDQEQTLISKKRISGAFSVERDIINSKVYHDKFEKLPVNKNVQEMIYNEVGRLLEYTDSLDEDRMEQERMSILDYITGIRILDNFDRDGTVYQTGITKEELDVIHNNSNSVIVIHNHSHNGRPSGKDLLTFLEENKVKLSIVACHNGDLYAIIWVKEQFKELYQERIVDKRVFITDNDEVKRLAMTDMYRLNEQLSDKHKLFHVMYL